MKCLFDKDMIPNTNRTLWGFTGSTMATSKTHVKHGIYITLASLLWPSVLGSYASGGVLKYSNKS